MLENTQRKQAMLIAVLIVAGLLFMAMGFFLLASTPVDTTQKALNRELPNVVLIVMDAFRADRIGEERNGVRLTPFLDSLHGKAILFKNAVTPCTWTRPAMASLFTSLYVDTHQVYFGTISNDGQQATSDKLSEAQTPSYRQN